MTKPELRKALANLGAPERLSVDRGLIPAPWADTNGPFYGFGLCRTIEFSISASGFVSDLRPLTSAFMNPIYFLGWCFFRALYKFYFRWRVYNPERVPLTGPVILASNHASFIDPPLVGSGLRRDINYLARESLFRFPGIGALLRSWNAVPVDRG